MKSRILLFGPLPPPYTGQAAAFIQVVEAFPSEKILLVNIARFKSKVLSSLYTITHTVWYFIYYHFDTVYFTSSRSLMGSVKDIPLLLLGRWTGKRMINHLHGANFITFFSQTGILKPLIRYGYNKVDTSIILHEEMKKEFVDFPEMQIRIVTNCYDGAFDCDKRVHFRKKNQVLFLSALMRSKGILEFLDASQSVLRESPAVMIRIAGIFDSDQEMGEREIKKRFFTKYVQIKKEFPKQIEYLGLVTGKEKINLFDESSIFVLPTWHHSEAIPIAIIEAMRTGNAIITTKHNFLTSLIKPENGILVNPKSGSEIAEAITSLLADQARLNEIQQNNISHAITTFSPERYQEEIKHIILAP